MNRILTLKGEITNDPLVVGYSEMTDQQTTDSLNSETISAKQHINTRDIKSYLTLVGKYYPISQSTAASAKETMFNLQEFNDGFDMTVSGAETILTNMLDALIADGLIDVNDKTYILGLGDKLISRGEQLGLGTVKVGEVMEARA